MTLTPEHARLIARQYDLDYLVTEGRLDLPLAFSSGAIRVYRLRGAIAQSGHTRPVVTQKKPFTAEDAEQAQRLCWSFLCVLGALSGEKLLKTVLR